MIPLTWSLDHAGPITKNVEDAALILNAIAGNDVKDSTSSHVPVSDYTKALGGTLKGLRLGIPRGYFFDVLDNEIRNHVEKAIGVLEGLGIATEEVSLPYVEYTSSMMWAIGGAEASSYHEPFYRTRAEEYGRDVRASLEVNQFVLASHYLKAQRVRSIFKAHVVEVMKKVDILVTPTTIFPAPEIGQRILTIGNQELRVADGVVRLTSPFDLVGVPAISLPCGFTSSGLPIGFQIAGRHFQEDIVLKVAQAYEMNTSWHQRSLTY